MDLASGRPAHDYAEITGYALTFLASQPSLADDELAVGCRAAMWLAGRTRRGTLAAREGWDNDAYKEKWGAKRRWLYRYYYPAARELELDLLDSQDRWHRMARAAWQRMPLSGTEMVSLWLHKHL